MSGFLGFDPNMLANQQFSAAGAGFTDGSAAGLGNMQGAGMGGMGAMGMLAQQPPQQAPQMSPMPADPQAGGAGMLSGTLGAGAAPGTAGNTPANGSLGTPLPDAAGGPGTGPVTAEQLAAAPGGAGPAAPVAPMDPNQAAQLKAQEDFKKMQQRFGAFGELTKTLNGAGQQAPPAAAADQLQTNMAGNSRMAANQQMLASGANPATIQRPDISSVLDMIYRNKGR